MKFPCRERKVRQVSQRKLLSKDTFQSKFLFNLDKTNKGKLCVCVFSKLSLPEQKAALLLKTMVEFQSGHVTAGWQSTWSCIQKLL